MRVTLDSTILVRAFDGRASHARTLLLTILDGNHRLVLSNEILSETARVLRYPRLRARHLMSDSQVYDYVMFLQAVAEMVRPDPMLIAPIRDPNDIVVLQTAIIGGAEIICTTDEDFFHSPAREFLQSMKILVMDDASLMRLLHC